jgi:tetratricopeptide (TPR) repeat protein
MVATRLIILASLIVIPQAPAGWDATYQRVAKLVLDHKTAEAIAVLETVLKTSPGFDAARYELADTQRMLALEAALKGPSQEPAKRREFERAAANYRRVAQGTSEYKQLAVGKLLLIYGPDELNRPAEVIPFARQYIEISPQSAMGHVTLANALAATGQEQAATAALLAARTAVRVGDAPLLATMVIDYVLKTKTSSTHRLCLENEDFVDGGIEDARRLGGRDPRRAAAEVAGRSPAAADEGRISLVSRRTPRDRPGAQAGAQGRG